MTQQPEPGGLKEEPPGLRRPVRQLLWLVVALLVVTGLVMALRAAGPEPRTPDVDRPWPAPGK